MQSLLTPGVLGLLALLVLGTILTAIAVLYLKVIKPRIEASAYWQQYRVALEGFSSYVQDVILRIAFTPDLLEQYRSEAELTGRDVRLVAALHLLDNWTNERGIQLDEEELITAVEANLHRLKVVGVLEWEQGEEPAEQEPSESEGGGEAGNQPGTVATPAEEGATPVGELTAFDENNEPVQFPGESNEDYAVRAARLRGSGR